MELASAVPPGLLTCYVYKVVCLSCDVFVHAGFQAGAINAIGQSNLLVNLTVFRSNNGSQVPSIANVHSTDRLAVPTRPLILSCWASISTARCLHACMHDVSACFGGC